MGYEVKWVQENLGITRKALRLYEEKGLIPENIGSQRRCYSEEELDRIWNIKVLNGMGFTLNEIAKMAESPDITVIEAITPKIKKLEEEKEKIERHIGYAKMIRTTGRFPHRPSLMGSVKFEEFQEHALNTWNVSDDPVLKEYSDLADMVLRHPEEEWKDTDLGKMLAFLESVDLSTINLDAFYTQKTLPRQLAKRSNLSPDHPEVQLIVKMIFDFYAELLKDVRFTKEQFCRFSASTYMVGDLAEMNKRELGEDACNFIANAFAVFAGYSGTDDPDFY